jgi:hypothetical protein
MLRWEARKSAPKPVRRGKETSTYILYSGDWVYHCENNISLKIISILQHPIFNIYLEILWRFLEIGCLTKNIAYVQ